jgi:drug/metabolite transporter (DMT)-like permease
VLPFITNDLALTPRSFAILASLGIFQLALAYFFFTRGLALVTATQASLTGMIEPIANPLWVFLFLHERPSPFAIAGAVVVLTAIAWHTVVGEPVSEMPPVD